MFAEFACWAYQYLAGIRLADDLAANGFRKVVIDPKPIADLAWANASLKLPNGTLAAGWRRTDGGVLELFVEIPAGTEAEIRFGGRVERVAGPWKGVRTTGKL